MAVSDQDLLRRWSDSQDAEAFRQIALRHSAMVFSTSRRILRDAARAEDVTQECFQRLAFSRGAVAARSLAAWLYRVATNLSLKQLRADRRRKERETRSVAARANAAKEAGWNEIQDHVDQAISELPEELRQAVVLHFIENRSHAAIARELGVARATVSYRVARAIERVRAKLRRSGVFVTGVALAEVLGERLVAETPPASLLGSLGRMAIAGTGTIAGAGKAAAPVTAVLSTLGGVIMAKKLAVGAVLILGALTFWHATSNLDTPPEPRQPAPPLAVVGTTPVGERPEEPSRATAAEAADAAPGAPAVAPCAIVGRVFDADTGEPFAGAGVLLRPQNETLPTVTRTDTDGLYRFTGLDPGAYRVERLLGDEGLPRFRSAEARTITLAEDQIAEGIDFALSMGLRVTGIVVDADGDPFAGARVVGRDPEGDPRQHTVTSDESGRFEFVGLRQTRDLMLEAEKESDGLVSDVFGPEVLTSDGLSGVVLTLLPSGGFSGRVVDPEGRPLPNVLVSPAERPQRSLGHGSGRTAEDGTFNVSGLAAGEYRTLLLPEGEGRVTFSTPKAPFETFSLEPGEVIEGVTLVLDVPAAPGISGRVVDQASSPIGGAEIDFLSPAGHSGVSARSQADGRFRGFDLKDGVYTLRVTHERFSTVHLEEVRSGSDAVKVVMPPCGVLEGRVVDAESGEAITEFELLYLDEYNRYFTGAERRFERIGNAEGRFRLDKVHAGRVTVAVRAPGYAKREIEVPRIEPGETIAGLELALRQGALLSGRVLDPSGSPLEGAAIIPGALPRSQSPEVAAATRTDAEGEFVLTDVPSDVRTVSAFHVLYATGSADVTLAPGEETRVTLVLKLGGTVQGTVFHDGRPWAGQHVRLYAGPVNKLVETETSATGAYRFDNVDLGPAEVIAIGSIDFEKESRRDRWNTQTIIVESGAVMITDFHFAPGTTAIEGKITERGDPIAGANLQLFLPGVSGRERRHFRMAQDGSFRFENVPPGPASLFISIRHGDRYRRVELDVPPDRTLEKDIELTEGLSVSGTVSGGSDDSPAGFRVAAFKDAVAFESGAPLESVRASFHQLMAKVSVDAAGRFVIEGLPRGTYALVATSWDPWSGGNPEAPLRTARATAIAGQAEEVHLLLE